jgi:hypothetical protein
VAGPGLARRLGHRPCARTQRAASFEFRAGAAGGGTGLSRPRVEGALVPLLSRPGEKLGRRLPARRPAELWTHNLAFKAWLDAEALVVLPKAPIRLGQNTLSRGEAGRNVQTAAMDVLLRVLRDVPGGPEYVRRNAAQRRGSRVRRPPIPSSRLDDAALVVQRSQQVASCDSLRRVPATSLPDLAPSHCDVAPNQRDVAPNLREGASCLAYWAPHPAVMTP